MKHRKILSALLALAMMMALAVPAMAISGDAGGIGGLDQDSGGLFVVGKADEEVVVQDKHVTLRSWQVSEPDENKVYTLTKGDGEDTVISLVTPQKSDTLVFTGLNEYTWICGLAYSDPDGDGVYDQRLLRATAEENGDCTYKFEPADIASPLTSINDPGFPLNTNYAEALYLDFMLKPDGAIGLRIGFSNGDAQIQVSVAKLMEIFGPNTLLRLECMAFTCAVLLPGEDAEPAQPAEAGTYTVKYGDTWGQLALNNYGSYGAWRLLWKANGYKGLSTGKDIVLPEKLGSYTRLPAQVLAEGEKLYTVKAGDTLGQIAAAEYGDMSMYKAIFERNSDRLKSANSIYEGQVLVLPVKPAGN